MAQGEYTSEFTGEQIDALLEKVDQRVSTPAPAEDKLITSGGVYTGLAGKTDKVTSPTAGNLPKLKADGSLEDSGKKPSDFVEKEAGKGLSSNDYTDTEKAKLGALPTNADLQTALGNKEDKSNKVTSFSNPTDTQYPSAKLVSDSLDKVKEDVSSLLTRAGIAEGIADTISAGTAQEFLQRQSGGDGVNCIKRIDGKTIAWNQIFQVINIRNFTGDSGVYTIINNDSDTYITFKGVPGHSYLLTCTAVIPSGAAASFGFPAANKHTQNLVSGRNSWVATSEDTAILSTLVFDDVLHSASAGITLKDFILVDLTLLGLGDLAADQFRALYPKINYAYNPGVLKSNDAAALLTDGRNQWNEEWEVGTYNTSTGEKTTSTSAVRCKNKIRVLPSTQYYFRRGGSVGDAWAMFFDADGNIIATPSTGKGSYNNAVQIDNYIFTTPTNCCFVVFYISNAYGTTYKNDICINLSDASFNGTYQPYWSRVLALRLSKLTGIPEGGTEADRVTMFPNGAGGAGSAFDSLFVENGVTKARKTMKRVDMGDLSWSVINSYRFYAQVADAKQSADCITTNYENAIGGTSIADKKIGFGSANNYVYIGDSAYTDAATFKAAMNGVYLEYELATPIVYTDLQYADGTPFTMPATILVDNYGKEVIVPPTGATTPSAPFCCDSNYSIGIANLVKKLNTL